MIRKIIINKNTYDSIDVNEYERRKKLDNPLFEDTCIEVDSINYPIQKVYDPRSVGVFDADCFFKFTRPNEEVMDQYSSKNIIDFDKADSFADTIKNLDKIRMAESARLTTKNNILLLNKSETDSPELCAIKDAINSKQIDAESYRERFPSDSDFNNDMRLLKDSKNNNISFFKMKRILNAFDIDAILTIKDKEGAINPINRTIKVKLTKEE